LSEPGQSIRIVADAGMPQVPTCSVPKLRGMADEERDETADWVVADDRRPPTVLELQQRIDLAVGIAQAAEAAALEIGAASLEAAEQARRAAALAERASEASVAASRIAASHVAAAAAAPVAAAPDAPIEEEQAPPARIPVPPLGTPRPQGQPDPFDERMVAFRERAEKVMARLRRLEGAPPAMGSPRG
jgi:hypothetical protein